MDSPAPHRNNSTLGMGAALVLLVALIILANRREIEVRHFFTADDWNWLYNSAFESFATVLGSIPVPHAIYNDRPMGWLAIKLLYSVFGLDMKGFQWAQLAIHAANCVLLYFIGARYVGRAAALLAAALAGTWIAADNAVFWTAAMFDLLAAFFCLLSILLWQLSYTGRRVLFLALATLSYFLAVRTKEFAIGLPVLLFFMGFVLERRSVREVLKELAGFIAVMALLAAAYAFILYLTPARVVGAADNTYGLHFLDIPRNLWYYTANAFYSEFLGAWVPLAAVAALLAAAIASAQAARIIGVSMLGFALLLGPTLLLSGHRDTLYLYAPHFFLALAVATLATLNVAWKVVGVAFAAVLLVLPGRTGLYRNHLAFYEQKTSIIHDQFVAFTGLAGRLPAGATVFISGLEEYHNPFSYRAGDSIRIHQHDASLRFVIEKPDAQLKTEFCAAPSPKYFITFTGSQATNDTAAVTQACGPQPAPPLASARP